MGSGARDQPKKAKQDSASNQTVTSPKDSKEDKDHKEKSVESNKDSAA